MKKLLASCAASALLLANPALAQQGPGPGPAPATGGGGCTVSGTVGQIVYNSGSAGCLASGATTDAGGDFSGASITAANTSLFRFNGRGILTSTGVGEFKLGNVDAAAPVAEVLDTQSVAVGTSNIAGVSLTINGSRGTGTGAGGSIVLATAVTGTTGSTQNALQTVATLDTNQHVKFSSAAIPTIGAGTVTAGSTDVAGSLTTGTTVTSVVLSFKIAYATAPFCVAQDETATVRLLSYSVSTTAITLTMTSNTGDVVQYVCHGA